MQQQASALAAIIDTTRTKLEILGEEYDQAQSRGATLAAQISVDRKAIASAESTVQKDKTNLHAQALDAYVDAGATTGLSAVFSANSNALPLQQTYLGIAESNLSTAVVSLQNSERRLAAREATLTTARTQANSAASTLTNSQEAASGVESQLSSTLASVKGNLSAAVDQEENAQAAAQAAEAAAQATAQQAAAQATADGGAPGASGTPATTAPGGTGDDPGDAALKAAETQLGVPYVWAGASPGAGFDCSGLAMWAWGQAGVNLPHSAEGQYEDTERVPFSQLEPGDLIFYASGDYVYHVVMYAGGGQVIQAIETGTNIQITPIPYGAFAAGRP
jgi:cell wall-associated NlpC family hydrolase